MHNNEKYKDVNFYFIFWKEKDDNLLNIGTEKILKNYFKKHLIFRDKRYIYKLFHFVAS